MDLLEIIVYLAVFGFMACIILAGIAEWAGRKFWAWWTTLRGDWKEVRKMRLHRQAEEWWEVRKSGR